MVTFDASAAFDRINVFGLLSKLIDKVVSCRFVGVLLSWYSVSLVCLKMGHCYTDYIDLKSEVQQGGIMSPQLYDVYVDDLMEKLLNEELGCMIGAISYGVVFYADIILLSWSKCKMQRMIDICCDYGMINGITIILRRGNGLQLILLKISVILSLS